MIENTLYPLNSPLIDSGLTGYHDTTALLGPTTSRKVKLVGASAGMSSPEKLEEMVQSGLGCVNEQNFAKSRRVKSVIFSKKDKKDITV